MASYILKQFNARCGLITRFWTLKLLTAQLACVEKFIPIFRRTQIRAEKMRPHISFEPLTEREMEVLYLIAEGMSNKEIADRLNITINTVSM